MPASCPACGNELIENSKFCIKCGEKLTQKHVSLEQNPQVRSTQLYSSIKPSKKLNKKKILGAIALIIIIIILVVIFLFVIRGGGKFVGKWHVVDTNDYFTFNADGSGIMDIDAQGFLGRDRIEYSITWKVNGDIITIKSQFGEEDYSYTFVDDPNKYEGAEVLLYLNGKCVMGLRKI